MLTHSNYDDQSGNNGNMLKQQAPHTKLFEDKYCTCMAVVVMRDAMNVVQLWNGNSV